MPEAREAGLLQNALGLLKGGLWRPLALGALFLVLFLPQIVYLVGVVWEEEKYSHGFLIPVVSLWVLWLGKEEIAAAPRRPSSAGLVFLALGMLGWVVAQGSAFNALAHLSMMLTIVGMVLFAAGWSFLRLVAFPVCFLVFAFPVPERLDDLYVVLPLQRLASTIAEHVIDLCGIPVLRQGNVIDVPGIKLLVEEACSGIHSLYSLMALGTAFVFVTERRVWERIVLIASTLPIAVLANVFRVTLTGLLAYWVSPDIAKGFLHMFSGLMVFLLGLCLLFLEAYLLSRWFRRAPEAEAEGLEAAASGADGAGTDGAGTDGT